MNRIILSGGPGTGKSSVIKALLNKGHTCMEESFREFVSDEDASLNFQNSPLHFSELLFKSRKQQYLNCHPNHITFFDRSLIDIIAYLALDDIECPQDWLEFIHTHKYSKTVLYFPIWEAIYQKDSERVENVDEAKKIDLQLRKTYGILGYEILEIPKLSIPKRVEFIRNWIKSSI